jgi:hypothetical protein
MHMYEDSTLRCKPHLSCYWRTPQWGTHSTVTCARTRRRRQRSDWPWWSPQWSIHQLFNVMFLELDVQVSLRHTTAFAYKREYGKQEEVVARDASTVHKGGKLGDECDKERDVKGAS